MMMMMVKGKKEPFKVKRKDDNEAVRLVCVYSVG